MAQCVVLRFCNTAKMKKLPLFLLLMCACASVKKQKSVKKISWSVATVEEPKAKVPLKKQTSSSPHHYSVVSFPADSSGKKRNGYRKRDLSLS
jgi:hypothetical protein